MPGEATGALAASRAAITEAPEADSRPAWGRVPLGAGAWIALGFLVLVVLASILAPLLPLDSPTTSDYHAVAAPPSGRHWLGTDQIGRDLLSRLIWGGRVSFTVGIGSTLIGAVVGSSIGLVAGFRRGWAGAALMRLMDVLLAFPAMLLALAVLTAVGPSLATVTITIGVLFIPAYARIVRATVLSLSQREFVLAATAVGMPPTRIVFGEVLPNVLPLITTFGLATFGISILVEGGLSFLGVSVPPPTPSWGGMIAAGRPLLTTAPFVSLIPIAALSAVVLAANTLGDALSRRDRAQL